VEITLVDNSESEVLAPTETQQIQVGGNKKKRKRH
jgi:hypothetical protein